jgi:membrane-associated phospholipid phosphatase
MLFRDVYTRIYMDALAGSTWLANGIYIYVYVQALALGALRRRWRRYYAGLVAVGLVCAFLRYSLRRLLPESAVLKRPCEVDECNTNLLFCGGMPSGHAAVTSFAFVALSIVCPSPATYGLALLSVLLMCLSRFVGRMHTPLQLAAGCLVGSASAYATFRSG